MARGGLYKTDIEKARSSLLAQGKHPSVDAVRVALGNTGSKSTIHRYLKELEAEEAQGVGAKVAVSDALQDLVGRLAGRLHEEAEALITEARERFDAQIKERDAGLERLKQEAAALSAQLQRTEVALQAESQQRAQAEQALQANSVLISQLEERVAGLTARLDERDRHIESLETKHTHARETLEHYRTSVKEQRDQEQRRHEHQVQALQVELRQANEALTGKNHELMQLNRENARMTEQLGQLGKDLQQAHSDLRRQAQQLDEHKGLAQELHALQAQWAQALQTGEQLRTELATVRKDLESEREHRRQAESNAIGLTARIQVLDEMFVRIQPAPAPATAADSHSKTMKT